MYNVAGQKVLAYNVYRCWPSEYTAILSSMALETPSLFSRSLQCEGWERDDSVDEPEEPEDEDKLILFRVHTPTSPGPNGRGL